MRLNTTSAQAQFLVDRFLGLFPQLRAALKDYPAICKIRGYADSVTGLRRHRPQGMTYRGSEGNWMLNHPIQASACSIFKHAGNRLHRLYPQYGAKIIIPFHDAYVFEAPLSHYEAVAQLTCDVMIQSVQEFYPQLRPRVERNLRFPHCWNKDGAADLIDRWLNDPLDTH